MKLLKFLNKNKRVGVASKKISKVVEVREVEAYERRGDADRSV